MIEYKLKSISIKSGITALAAVGLMGIMGYECGDEPKKCAAEEANDAYDYCYDYAGKYACDTCQECVARMYDSSCEKHCERGSGSGCYVDKGY